MLSRANIGAIIESAENSIYNNERWRALGFLEALLMEYGFVDPGEKVPKQSFEVPEYNWLGKKKGMQVVEIKSYRRWIISLAKKHLLNT